MKAALLGAAFLFVAAGCATQGLPPYGKAEVQEWARQRGLWDMPLRAGNFELFALGRQTPGAQTLSIYIEGDGAPWGLDSPPRDPTPREAIALALAATDRAPAL